MSCFPYNPDLSNTNHSSEEQQHSSGFYWRTLGFSSSSWCQSGYSSRAASSFTSMWMQWGEYALCVSLNQTCFILLLMTLGFAVLALFVLGITIASWNRCRNAKWLGMIIRTSAITAVITLGLLMLTWAMYSQAYLHVERGHESARMKSFGSGFHKLIIALVSLIGSSIAANSIAHYQNLQNATRTQQLRYQRLHQNPTDNDKEEINPLDCPASYLV